MICGTQFNEKKRYHTVHHRISDGVAGHMSESPHDMREILRHIKCGATHGITVQNTVRQRTPVTDQYAGMLSVSVM